MRFIQHRTRMNYWSLSKFSKRIRKAFGLTNPKWFTMDDGPDSFHAHEQRCKNTSPIVHWITDTGFNKLQNAWMFIPDVIYTIKVAPIWKFFRTVYKLRKSLWYYRSWDYGGLLYLMEEATKDMYNTHKNHGNLVRSEDTAKELLIVSTLLKRIREDKYTDEVQGYEPQEGKMFGGEFYQKPNTLPSVKYKKFYKMREAVKQNDLDLVCKIMKTKLFSWWD